MGECAHSVSRNDDVDGGRGRGRVPVALENGVVSFPYKEELQLGKRVQRDVDGPRSERVQYVSCAGSDTWRAAEPDTSVAH